MTYRVHDIRLNKQSTAAPVDVSETMTGRLPSLQDSAESPAGLSSRVQSLDIDGEKNHGQSTYTGNDQENFVPEQNALHYADTSKFPVEMLETSHNVTAGSPLENMTEEDRLKWGEGEGIDINDLLSHIDKSVSKDDTEETVFDNKIVDNGIDKLPSQKRCTSPNVLADQIEDVGGMDVNDGLPPWTKNSSAITGGPSAKDTTYSNEEHLSTLSVQLSGLSPTPPPRGGVNLLRPVSLGAVGHPVTTGDSIPSDAQLAIQVGLVATTEDDRNKSMHDAEKWDTGADFSLNDGAREITNGDRIILALYDGWPYKSSDVNTGLPPMLEESSGELESKQTIRRFASDDPSEVDIGRMTAEHNPSAGTGPLRSFVANVSSLRNLELDEPCKLFDPPEPEPIPQEEAASDLVRAFEHSSEHLSGTPFHAANSGNGTQSVVDTAHRTRVPQMNVTVRPMKDTTKDMPVDFGLHKWIGDNSVEQETKYTKLVSSDSERPQSPVASRDASFILWTDCYPDDPDKARELEASTGAPGIRVHSADVLFRATSNPQVLDEVDASQNSDNSRTEMETQIPPRRLSNE